MNCPKCNHKMTELFTSVVCDYCDNLVVTTSRIGQWVRDDGRFTSKWQRDGYYAIGNDCYKSFYVSSDDVYVINGEVYLRVRFEINGQVGVLVRMKPDDDSQSVPFWLPQTNKTFRSWDE